MPNRTLLLLLFLLSGTAALIYQILWTRRLILVFGSTTFAVSAVLTAFMIGLALGAYTLGRAADRSTRPLRLYAGLELGIAACALALPLAFDAFSRIYPALYAAGQERAWLLPAARLLASVLVLLAPCTLIGGTLPVLIRFIARAPERFGRDFGWFYGVNTLGALAGALLAGFYLIGGLGLRATNGVAIAANLLLAAAFLALDARAGPSPLPQPAQSSPPAPALTGFEKLIVAMVALSGLTVLALEVLWTRILVQVLFSSTHSFTAVLSVLLLALALGSFLTARSAAAGGPDAARRLVLRLAWIELLLGVALLAELPVLAGLAELRDSYVAALRLDFQVTVKFLLAVVVLALPATLAGMVFPLSAHIISRRLSRPGGFLGRLYLLNTLAAAAGALLAGFALIPLFGAKWSYIGIATLHVAVAVGLGFAASRRRVWLLGLPLAAAGVVAGAWILDRPDPFGHPLLQSAAMGRKLAAYEETADATFAVYESEHGGYHSLHINGYLASADWPGYDYMPMMGHLPVLLHPQPRRVLVIGFGGGRAAGAAALHPIERLDVVDISPQVYRLAAYFASSNHNVLHDPRTRAWVEDGRNFVMATRDRYDVITSEPSPPKFATMVNFYTREYYQAARARLNPRGRICQWVPFHNLTTEDARMLVATFVEAFPDASLWMVRGWGLLVASVDADPPLPADLADRMSRPAVADDLARLRFASPEDLFRARVLDAAELRAFSAGALLLTDNNPYLEFSTGPTMARLGAAGILAELRRPRAASGTTDEHR